MEVFIGGRGNLSEGAVSRNLADMFLSSRGTLTRKFVCFVGGNTEGTVQQTAHKGTERKLDVSVIKLRSELWLIVEVRDPEGIKCLIAPRQPFTTTFSQVH